MKHTVNNLKTLYRLIEANKIANKDWYNGFDFEQVECLYRFAIGGYLSASAKNFGYIDAQSDCKYIRVLLLHRYLTMLAEREGIESARDEYSRLQAMGYFYFDKLNGEDVLCTSEGQTRVQRLNQGMRPEGSKGLFDKPKKKVPYDADATRIKTAPDLPIYNGREELELALV